MAALGPPSQGLLHDAYKGVRTRCVFVLWRKCLLPSRRRRLRAPRAHGPPQPLAPCPTVRVERGHDERAVLGAEGPGFAGTPTR